ncbi:MAG: bacteriocin family protein [Nonomuraea sp.]|nr:bacteriocin family protein [Nonomuraea sp.]
MNNLHRDLAPISAQAWAEIEEEAKRTFERHVAARRVVDVSGPHGGQLSAVGTGHRDRIDPPADGVIAHLRGAQRVVELKVPFTVSREAVDDVERGAKDSDWQPVKDAAKQIAFAEDRAAILGYGPADITGIAQASSNPTLHLPEDAKGYPDTVSQALSQLRLMGVNGPYSVLLSADAYTAVSETSDHGYPVLRHLERLVDGNIVWAPAIEGALVLTTRGGDYELHLGQDLSIGYLDHDADSVRLYFYETLTFSAYTAEAAVTLLA